MTDDQKFVFDLTGYLVVKDALTSDEVGRCNEAVEQHMDGLVVANPERVLSEESKTLAGPAKQYYLDKCLEWERPWCEPFREILVNPHIESCLNVILQKGYRLDGSGATLVVADSGAEGLVLHGGGAEAPTSMAYFCKNGIFYCGMTVVEVMLADEGPGDGGLAVIPGSHKANFPSPREIKLCDGYQEHITEVHAKAGDAVIFLETTIHGALAWKGQHQRRTLLFRFNPGFANYHGLPYELSTPDYIADMTEEQRAVMKWPAQRPRS